MTCLYVLQSLVSKALQFDTKSDLNKVLQIMEAKEIGLD